MTGEGRKRQDAVRYEQCIARGHAFIIREQSQAWVRCYDDQAAREHKLVGRAGRTAATSTCGVE